MVRTGTNEFYLHIFNVYEMLFAAFRKRSVFIFHKMYRFGAQIFRVKISVCRRVFIARLLMTITTNGETYKGDVLHQI